MPRPLLAVVLASAVASCAGDRMQDPGAGAFREQAQAVESAVTAYRADAANMPDAAACTDAHAAYDARVRPMLERMRELAAAMDAHLAEMGSPGDADMACAARAMMDELDRHAAAACTSPDMGANLAEAGAHAGVMTGWAEHERARADEMGSMMDGAGMGGMGGGMMGPGTQLGCPPAP